MRKQPSIADDLTQYPTFIFRNGKLKRLKIPPISWLGMQAHHFVRKSIRKNSPEFYKKIEHLQKIIFMSPVTNYDLETMGEVKFFQKYGINKNDLVFSRLKWREGYYDNV